MVGWPAGLGPDTSTISTFTFENVFDPTPNRSPGLAYGSDAPDGSSVQIQGFFRSNTTSDLIVVFAEYPGCGDGFGLWAATKR